MGLSARDELEEGIFRILISKGVDIQNIKNELWLVLDKYEITERTTEVAPLKQDRNEYLLQKFLMAKIVKGCTKQTVAYYKDELNRFFKRINMTVDDITIDDLRIFFANRQVFGNVSKSQISNEYRTLSSFYSYLFNEGLVNCNVVKKLDIKANHRTKKTAYTEMEIEQIRNNCQDERIACFVEILISTACRISEVIQMRIDEIEGDKIIVHGKGEKDRTVYLNAKALMSISKYLSLRKDTNQYLFPSSVLQGASLTSKSLGGEFAGQGEKAWWKNPKLVSKTGHVNKDSMGRQLNKIGKKIGIRVHAHNFRRTCATMALRRGMPIEQVSKMLGHAELSTTQIYLDLSEADLQQAHKRFVV